MSPAISTIAVLLGAVISSGLAWAQQGARGGADIEAHWYIGQYVLPGNVPRVILKPKALRQRTLNIAASAASAKYRQ